MPDASDGQRIIRPSPLVISRTFAAPRALVFRAWSSAEHVKHWFSPVGYTAPAAEVDFRTGGVFAVCMRSPEGQDFWSRGHFVEVSPPDRLVFASSLGEPGAPKFSAHATVTFEDDGAGTRMTVRQEYEVYDEAFLRAVESAPEGWRSTLDKLEREVARIRAVGEHAVAHGTFALERSYAAPRSRVFRAFADQTEKARWFEGGPGYTVVERHMDVRPGGRERLRGRWASGVVSTFDVVYFDVVPDWRLVYAYEMHQDERKISVSLATLELHPQGTGTRLVVTEHGAFLDGYDDAGSREKGTGMLLNRLGAALER